MSTNKTENYQLNQWVGADRILMDDFNADNAKIDAALKGLADGKADESVMTRELGHGGVNCRVVCGSYVGDGNGGRGSSGTPTKPPTSISNLPFYPVLVIVTEAGSAQPMILMRPSTHTHNEYSYSDDIEVTWGDDSVNWRHSATFISGTDLAQVQMNSSGVTYYYTAIGYTLPST